MSIVLVFRYSIFEQVILIDLLMLLKCSESQFGLKICFGYNRNYKAMLIVVNGALDTLALVTSLDYLSPLLLEPIPIQGQDQVRHQHKKKSCDKIIPAIDQLRGREEWKRWHGGGIAYKDLTMHKAKRWHTITGKGLCAVMWLVVILHFFSL
jgi:hypothetical protein